MKAFIKIISLIFIISHSINLGFAQSNAKKAAISFLKNDNRSFHPDTLIDIIVNEEMENFTQAIGLCEILGDNANQKNDLTNLYKSYRIRGTIYETYLKKDSALIFHQLALEVSQQIGGEEGMTRQQMSILDIAYTYSLKMDYTEAFEWFQKNIDLANAQNEDEYKVYAYYGMSEIYTQIYDYEKAIATYLKVLELGYEQEDYTGIVLTLSDIADIYTKMGHLNLALDAFEEAQQVINKTEGDVKENLQANLAFAMGAYHNEQKNYDQSAKEYKKAQEGFQLISKPYQATLAYLKLGETVDRQGKFELALYYLNLVNEGIDYLDYNELADFFYIFGNIYFKKGQIEDAANYYKKSLEISLENDVKTIAQKNYFGLYQYKRAKKDYKKALDFHLKYTELDSVFNDKNQKKAVAEMRYKYNIKDKEKEITELQRANEWTLFVTLISFLGLAILVLIVLFRARVKNNELLKTKNEEIQQQFRQLKESHNALEQFAFVAAHDLKEPLRTIGGYSSLMKRQLDNASKDTQKEYLSFMSEAAKKLSSLLDDLLFYANISKELPGHEPVNINKAISSACEMIENTIQESNAVIKYAENSPINITANSLHIQLVFKELISNAINFNKSTPQIIIQLKKDAEDLIITIADNGIGLDQTYKNKVFNIFNRLDKRTGYQGTGVGLTLVKNIVEKYQGSIDYYSNTPQGTIFEIKFPISIVSNPEKN